MTLPRRQLGAVAVLASAISLAVPGVASATGTKAGDRTFQQTYPLASKVCASVAAGSVWLARVTSPAPSHAVAPTCCPPDVLSVRVPRQTRARPGLSRDRDRDREREIDH